MLQLVCPAWLPGTSPGWGPWRSCTLHRRLCGRYASAPVGAPCHSSKPHSSRHRPCREQCTLHTGHPRTLQGTGGGLKSVTGARRPLAKIHGRCLGLALPHAVNTPSAADTSNPCSAQANYSSAAARAGDGTGPRGTGNSTCLGQTGVDKGEGGGLLLTIALFGSDLLSPNGSMMTVRCCSRQSRGVH